MIRIKNMNFGYEGKEPYILEDINLHVKQGEFLCVIGHSGCGKSTLVRLISGLERPTTGTVEVNGQLVDGPQNKLSVVFQQYSLFPWMNVRKNVLFAIQKTGRYSPEECKARATTFLEKVGMKEHENKYPFQLSGGMRQRTAIAKALAMGTDLLLLDEPFGALDVQNRTELQELLYNLWKEEIKTVVFVTHDLDEAMKLGTRIVFLRDRKVAREMNLAEQIRCCCMEEQGLTQCKDLRAELEEWYR